MLYPKVVSFADIVLISLEKAISYEYFRAAVCRQV